MQLEMASSNLVYVDQEDIFDAVYQEYQGASVVSCATLARSDGRDGLRT